jgi:hypothetical protein
MQRSKLIIVRQTREEHVGDRTGKKPSAVAEELRGLLNGDHSEETVHQFFADRVFGIGHGNPRGSEWVIVGTVSKFPITPDRIPDFCSAVLNVRRSQSPSRVSFVELKKPNAPLYTGRRLMSKDLNDAWVECVETSRLIADNFRDYLRRLVKALDEKRLREFDKAYEMLEKTDERANDQPEYLLYDDLMPRFNSVIVIGRRASLDSEGLLRTRELSASTGSAISVITYDTVLDWMSEAGEDKYRGGCWNMFMRGWYW